MINRAIWFLVVLAALMVCVACWGVVIGASVNAWGDDQYSTLDRLGIMAFISVFGLASSALLLLAVTERLKR